jgi:hypothetical protein
MIFDFRFSISDSSRHAASGFLAQFQEGVK